MGQIHALYLQLIAKGIINYDVKDRSKIGTERLKQDDLFLICPKMKFVTNGIQCCLPGYMVNSLWDGLNLTKETSPETRK